MMQEEHEKGSSLMRQGKTHTFSHWGKSVTGSTMISTGRGPQCPSSSRLANMSSDRLQSMMYKEIYRRLAASPNECESLIVDAFSPATGKYGCILSWHPT